MHRFFVPSENISDKTIRISGSDVNHIKNVLRMAPHEKIEVFDSLGNIYQSEIEELKDNSVICSIISEKKENIESHIDITLAQCLPKGKKMDFIIQKATELGVNYIIPVISERSIPKIEEKADKKIDHWQKIAKEASEQSGRSKVPEIKPLSYLKDIITAQKLVPSYDLKIIPWEGEKEKNLKFILEAQDGRRDFEIPPSIKILILIGPEGGFSKQEVQEAKDNGFISVSLGKRILRVETAAIAILAQIFYELEM